MSALGIDPEKNEDLRRKVAEWTPESPINVEELGHYLEVWELMSGILCSNCTPVWNLFYLLKKKTLKAINVMFNFGKIFDFDRCRQKWNINQYCRVVQFVNLD